MTDKVRLIYNKIENRIDEICDDGFVLKENQQEYETLTDLEDFINSLPEEPESKELEEYAKKLAKGAALDKHNLIWMCKKGAEWQKQQMMKDAVEGEVVYKIGSSTDIRYKVMSDKVYIPNVKLGDKVKIIIVKEEQQ